MSREQSNNNSLFKDVKVPSPKEEQISTMSRAYLTCVTHHSNQIRSQNKSVNSVKKKKIIDSSILDQTSESCIVNDESTQDAPSQIKQTTNTNTHVGKVGMSSRVSSKISFNFPFIPKKSIGRNEKQPQSAFGFSVKKNSLINCNNNKQRSVFSEVLMKNASSSNIGFKTIDDRAVNKSISNSKQSFETKSSKTLNPNNLKLSCCTTNRRDQQELNLDRTQEIVQDKKGAQSAFIAASNLQNIVQPNVILSQSFNRTVELNTNSIPNPSPHFYLSATGEQHYKDKGLQLKNFQSMKLQNKLGTTLDKDKFSIFNTLNTQSLPEGSSHFMQTTYSHTDQNKRQIPNEISESSTVKHPVTHVDNESDSLNDIQIAEENEQLTPRDLSHYPLKPTHSKIINNSPLESQNTECEKNLLTKLNEEYIKMNPHQNGIVATHSGHSPKQIIQSQFSSTMEFGPSSTSLKSSNEKNVELNHSSISKISMIRNELRFPSIKMNKVQEHGPNFFNSGSECKVISIENKNQINQDIKLAGHFNQTYSKPVIQQISLQPSLDSSAVKHEEMQSRVNSSNYANSLLEEMCQEISDIKIVSDNQSKRIINGISINDASGNCFSESRDPSSNKQRKKQGTNSRLKLKKKSVDPNHQEYLFPECTNESDFLIQGQGQGSSKGESQQIKQIMICDNQDQPETEYGNDKIKHTQSMTETHSHEESKQDEKLITIPIHINNQSSFGGFEPPGCGSFAKGNLHQQTHALLENSCVTFQYYNSQFASNQTLGDCPGQHPVQNVFYLTNESHDSKYNSKESGKLSAGAFPPDIKQKYQHKKVSDIIGLSEDEDVGELPLHLNADQYFSLQDQIIQERDENEEESEKSERSQDHANDESRYKQISKHQSSLNHKISKQSKQSKTKVAVIDLGFDREINPLNTFESLNPSQRKEKIFLISDTKGQDSRNKHIIKSASNNEMNSYKVKNGYIVYDTNMHGVSSQREFIVDESNDQSYTILQAASVSNQKGREQADYNHLTTMHSNLNSNHKLTYLHSGVSVRSQTPQEPNYQLMTQNSNEKELRQIEHKMIQFDDQIKMININQLQPQILISGEKIIEDESLLADDQIEEQPVTNELKTAGQQPPVQENTGLEMNIVQYPSEMNNQSVNINDESKQGSFINPAANSEIPLQGGEGDLSALFMKMNQLSALCHETDLEQPDQISNQPEDKKSELKTSHQTSHISQVSESSLQSRIAMLSNQIAHFNKQLINQENQQEMDALEEFKTNEIQVYNQMLNVEAAQVILQSDVKSKKLTVKENAVERPKSSMVSSKSGIAVPPKQQNSENKYKEPLVNQSISSLNSKNKSKWQNQFRSRSKTKSILSNKSRNACLTDREISINSNGQGLNMKRDITKSRSFVNFNTNKIPTQGVFESCNLENKAINFQQTQLIVPLHKQISLADIKPSLPSSRSKQNAITKTGSAHGSSGPKHNGANSKSRSKLIPPTLVNSSQLNDKQLLLPTKMRTQVKNKSRQQAMTQRQNYMQTEPAQGEKKYGSMMMRTMDAMGSLQMSTTQKLKQSNSATSSCKGGNKQITKSKRCKAPRSNVGHKVPDVVSLNLVAVSKKHTSFLGIKVADLKVASTHQQNKELSRDIQSQINELNQIYKSLEKQNI